MCILHQKVPQPCLLDVGAHSELPLRFRCAGRPTAAHRRRTPGTLLTHCIRSLLADNCGTFGPRGTLTTPKHPMVLSARSEALWCVAARCASDRFVQSGPRLWISSRTVIELGDPRCVVFVVYSVSEGALTLFARRGRAQRASAAIGDGRRRLMRDRATTAIKLSRSSCGSAARCRACRNTLI